MKKAVLSGITFLFASILILAALVFYSPHFFIKHLLKGTIQELQSSGFLISLVEPEPRKTAIHLSIPSMGLRDILLEPRLVISRWLPPSLDVGIDKNLSPLSIAGLDFKTFGLKLVATQLLSQTPRLEVKIEGSLFEKHPLTVEIQAISRELSEKRISFDGSLSVSNSDFNVKGPLIFNWDLAKDLPDVTFNGTATLFGKRGDLALAFSQKTTTPTINLQIKGLSHPNLPSHLNFELNSTILMPKAAQATATGILLERHSGLKTSIKGKCSGDFSSCRFDYALPIRFNEKFTPEKIFPQSKKALVGWEGDLTLKGTAEKRGNDIRCGVTVLAKELSGFAYETPFVDIKGSADLSLFPHFKSKTPAYITVGKIGENLSLDLVKTRFSISPIAIQVDELTAGVKGGRLTFRPSKIPIPSYEGSYLFTLDSMDLRQFLLALKSDRLSGEGTIDGNIPFKIQGGNLIVSEAVLRNRGPGRIRYLDDSIRDVKEKIEYLADFNDLLSRGQQALAYKALSDFHYSILELRANRTSAQRLSVALHLKGKNPNLAKGQPFEINLPISGNLESFLIESLLKSSMESEE